MSDVTSIVLTGGPCGGKSTSISVLEQELTNKGFQVIIVNEMATDVILSGLTPMNLGGYEFQKVLIQMQLNRNKIYEEASKLFAETNNKRVVIIFDRGIADGKAFVTDDEYERLLKECNTSEIEIMSSYDGVFHLVTAADGAENYYTCENNKARTETPEQAIERDRGCLRAWTGHPHLRVIDNKNKTFEQKVDKLLEEVYTLLGVPVPVEIERKFLIKMPDMKEIKSKFDTTTVDIIQTYLVRTDKNVERRIRQRGMNDKFTYYYTEKENIDNGLSRTEREKKITEQEYLRLMMEADTNLHQIRKQRTCFVYENQYFELDVYPFWTDRAIVEVELTNETTEVKLPDELVLIEEVTNDIKYKNNSLAKNIL